MRVRPARASLAAALLLLAGCASADPLVQLDPADPVVDPSAQVSTFTTLLTELYAHALDAAATPPTIISEGATVDVAVVELTEALDLGEGARDFAAATAFELAAADGAAVAEVGVVTSGVAVVGELDGAPVATVDVVLTTAQRSGPITEQSLTFAIVLDGDRLADVRAWTDGVDSGVGLASPTGAAQRFLDLVRSGDLEAARFFSGDVNTDTELGVLARATDERTSLTEVPQARLGSAHVVYALDADGRVLARFDVLLGSTTQVVYSPTS